MSIGFLTLFLFDLEIEIGLIIRLIMENYDIIEVVFLCIISVIDCYSSLVRE